VMHPICRIQEVMARKRARPGAAVLVSTSYCQLLVVAPRWCLTGVPIPV
jgi:hypothetical protein